MSTILMNSETSKTFDKHRLKLNLVNKMDLRRGDNFLALSDLGIYFTWKKINKLYKSNNFNIWNNKGRRV